jgi:alanine dehydrogenase
MVRHGVWRGKGAAPVRIGIPREIKAYEGRVALNPAACEALVRAGHEVRLELGAGAAAGYPDAAYAAGGARIAADADAVYAVADLIVKVKEPQPVEYPRLRREHLLFCFLHLAANPGLLAVLREKGLTAVGFETVEEGGDFPILAPMSDVAGRLAVQIGARLLHRPAGGKGTLLGGLPGARRGHVVVLGAGVVGSSAAVVAAALGAEVTVFDLLRARLERARGCGANVTALYPFPGDLRRAVASADLLIGAVYVAGARTPRLVDRRAVGSMEPGSVIIDVAVDQGGCVETTRAATYEAPTYVEEGVVHFGVTNMPAAVPRSASDALSAALIPYVLAIARPGWRERVPALAASVNVAAGQVVHPALAELEIQTSLSDN